MAPLMLWLMFLCSPYSAGWNKLGICAIKGFLRDLLNAAGFGSGKNESKLGIGATPVFFDILNKTKVNFNSVKLEL